MTVRKILVATYSSNVCTLSFDLSATPPSLVFSSALEVGHHPSWIVPHPINESIVFTATEEANGTVKALKYDLETGVGSIVAEARSGGADPCHLAILDNDLLVANYSSGSLVVFPLTSAEPYLPLTESQLVQFTGSGPIVSRQEASHPHQILVHPDSRRREIFIPDLGSDKTWRLQKTGNDPERWVVKGEVNAPSGGGPRHGVIIDEDIFLLMELSNEITAHKLPASSTDSSEPILIDVVATMSNPPADPLNMDPPPLSAEILSPEVSPEFPKRYLYVTNRNDRDPKGDILSIFEVLASGKPKLVNEVRTGLNHLRGIAFDDESKYLIAGGVFDHNVKIFERTDGGENLVEIASLAVSDHVQSPTGFYWLAPSQL